MDLSMVNRHDDEQNEVELVMDKVPHFITALIAIGGLIAAYFMTIGDFRLKDMELQQRMTYMEQKVEHIETTMDNIQAKLESRIPVVDQDRQDLRKEIDNLKEVIQQMRPMLKKTN